MAPAQASLLAKLDTQQRVRDFLTNAVASGRDITDFLGRRVRRLVRLDEIIERLAYRGGINGKFCHDHSLLLFLNSVKSCFRLVHRVACRQAVAFTVR